jgi:tetratricopeptide (TPR) repeat protein
MRYVTASLVALALASPAAASAQPAEQLDMDAIARALGVSCNYCHVGRDRAAESTEKSKLQIAREMIEMTRGLNATVQAATGRTEATRVECVTCHRGAAIPKQLSEIVLRTVIEKDGTAAAEQYRTLRGQYYGRQTYDFGEDELFRAVQRLVDRRPADAIALLEMNLEFHPQSSRSHVGLAQAYTRKRDPAAAIRHLEKAIEIDPDNGYARGRLAQLQDDERRRR